MDEVKLFEYFDRRFDEVRRQITADVTESVMARITPLFEELFRRVEALEQRVEALERRCDAMEEGIRHNGVLIEGVKSQVDFLAETVATFDDKLDRLRKELRGEIRDVRHDLEGFAAHTRKRLDAHEELEPRIERLEARVA